MLKRRDALIAGAGVISSAFFGEREVLAADQPPAASSGAGSSAFLNAVAICVGTGNACLQHCFAMFGAGDTSLAKCADSVNLMLAICRATGVVAAGDSRYRAQMVQLCSAVCEDCEKECRKHEKEHAICKTCADACAAVVKAAVMIS